MEKNQKIEIEIQGTLCQGVIVEARSSSEENINRQHLGIKTEKEIHLLSSGALPKVLLRAGDDCVEATLEGIPTGPTYKTLFVTINEKKEVQ